jgi:hypothetical protein
MHTFTPSVWQLRSLAFVAPGTLMLSADTFKSSTFITAEDDSARSNVWGITVTRDGDVTLHTNIGPDIARTYDDLMRAQREQIVEEEMIADLSD